MGIQLTEAERTSELLLWQVLKEKITELERQIERSNKLFYASPFMMGNHVAREKFEQESIKPLADKITSLLKRVAVIEKDFNL